MADLDQLICKQEEKIRGELVKLAALHREREPVQIENYKFKNGEGSFSLLEMFGAHDEMILIHNMGKACAYCALWADGFNGYYDHLKTRAAFVVISNDTPEVQNDYRAAKGWKFPMYSAHGTSLSKDLGFYCENDKLFQPGVSYLKRDSEGKILHTTNAGFGPGDLFSSFWHLIELLPNGVNDWEPKNVYPVPNALQAAANNAARQ